MNIIITGTAQGIGLELTRQALAQGYQVVAVVRSLDNAADLQNLHREFGERLQLLAVDLTTPEAPQSIAKAIEHWPHLDLLLNNAGVYKKDETLEDFLSTFHINSVLPLFLTRALLPKLHLSKAPKAVHITSLMGSVADNSSGGSYSYRASKAALNMINKSLSCDEPWLTAAVIHPGWVQTRMGGNSAPTTAKVSAEGIWQVIHNLNKNKSGHFYDYKGRELPW